MQFAYGFCNFLSSWGLIPVNAGNKLHETVVAALARYPNLRKLLLMDLIRIKCLPLAEVLAPSPDNTSRLARECNWEPVGQFFKTLEESSVLEYLEKQGVFLILEDDARAETDFSIY